MQVQLRFYLCNRVICETIFVRMDMNLQKKQDMLISSVQNDPCIRLNDVYQIMLQFKTNHLCV